MITAPLFFCARDRDIVLSERRFCVTVQAVFAPVNARGIQQEGAACMGNAPKAHRCLVFGVFALACLAAAHSLQAAAPYIEYITLYSTNQVTIHFPTEANRTYILQYTEDIQPAGTATTPTK